MIQIIAASVIVATIAESVSDLRMHLRSLIGFRASMKEIVGAINY